MQIGIDAPNERIAAQVDQLLSFGLSGLAHKIEHVRVRFRRQIDPLGDPLHLCCVHVSLYSRQSIDIHEIQVDPTLAITRALDRAARSIRRVERLRRLNSTV
ncbi:MAG: hypothetical protein KDH88_07835 [Chromatiales bacterium]|nr:hypothetical protein [Chromatiales bacterium]